MPNDLLYSNNPTERLSATIAITEADAANRIKEIKPFFWFGSANAWLVFLGSSPGGSPPKGKEHKSDYPSDVLYGNPSRHFESTKDGKGFWATIVDYTKTFFPEIPEKEVFRLILAGNLIDTLEGDSSKLDPNALKLGAVESYNAISLVKPKVVICLQKSVFELFLNVAIKNHNRELQEKEELIVNSGTARNVKYKVPIHYFLSGDELWGRWVLTKMPMHPSRSTLYKDEYFKQQFLEPLRTKANLFIG
jgi:hypothetical protein